MELQESCGSRIMAKKELRVEVIGYDRLIDYALSTLLSIIVLTIFMSFLSRIVNSSMAVCQRRYVQRLHI